MFIIISSHYAFAQSWTLHDRTLEKIANQSSGFYQIPQIYVDESPVNIAINTLTNKVYVANTGNDTISVIDGNTNTKIKDIPVGRHPTAIAVNSAIDFNSDYLNTVYVVNERNDSISVIDGNTNTKIDDIPVGKQPSFISILSNTVYVTNTLSNSISVIDAYTNTKQPDIHIGKRPSFIDSNDVVNTVYVTSHENNSITLIDAFYKTTKDISLGDVPTHFAILYDMVFVANRNNITVIDGNTNTKIDDIPVGGFPKYIAANRELHTVYVLDDDSISVIDGNTNTKIKDIPVDFLYDLPISNPSFVSINDQLNKVYVANPKNDSISVIDGNTNTKIDDIPVGRHPTAIAVNPFTNTVYVANRDSNSISVIDGIVNKVVAGIKFQVKPFNSGYIECNGLSTPIKQYMYLYSSSNCIAKPYQGFEFLSWEENLNNNSTQLITVSHSASTIFEDIVNSFHNIINYLGINNYLGISNSVKSEAILNVTKFGSFTANFRELPAPIPSEYWIPLYGLIPGFFIPSIIKWLSGKRQRKNLREYLDKIGKVDRHFIEKEILTSYSKGKISDFHYQMLKDKISQYYENTHIDK